MQINKPLEHDAQQWPVFSFAGGPTQLPRTVLRQLDEDFLNYHGIGRSLLEVGSNTKEFHEIVNSANEDLRSLYNLPGEFKIIFGQGGATLIFENLVYNLLGDHDVVSFANTGHWSEKAIKEAKYLTNVHEPCQVMRNERGLCYIPEMSQWDYNPKSAFLHYCDNETVEGLEFQFTPKFEDQICITDVSSNFLTRQMQWDKLDILYSHGQKNVGIAGSSITIIKQNLINLKKMKLTPSVCDFAVMDNNQGFPNTPPIYPIYVNSLMFRYIRETGGVEWWDQHSQRRAAKLYTVIDDSHGFYLNEIVPDQRSRISIAFNLANPQLLQTFFDDAEKESIIEIKGHRSRGGCRVCFYIPVSDIGIERLIDFMQRFALKHSQ